MDYSTVDECRTAARGRGYRAQVRSNDGSVWVNGGFFKKRRNAEADAQRMADLFGNEVQIIEQEDPLSCL